jgi:predicted CXXCH cytochrome family protein
MLVLVAFLAVASPSSACTACHDATNATVMESSHPYAVAYAPAVAAKPRRYREPALVQDLLLDGKVECTSCHVTHEESAPNPFRLRSHDIVKLCTACHVLSE